MAIALPVPKPICCNIGDGGTINGVLNVALLFADLTRCGVWNGVNGVELILIDSVIDNEKSKII